jgi:hypothetical protein
MQPDHSPHTAVVLLLRRARTRRIILDVCAAVTTALVVLVGADTGSRLLHAPWWGQWTAAIVAGAVAGWLAFARGRDRRTLAAAAAAIEQVQPSARNAVVTAEEIHRFPDRTKPWMAERVFAQAATATRGLSIGDVVPAARVAGGCAVAAIAALALALTPLSRSGSTGIAAVASRAAAAVGLAGSADLTVTVRPPAYVRAEQTTLRNPERLDVLQGSHLTLVTTGSTSQRIRLGSQVLGRIVSGDVIEVVARESGYLAIEGADGGRRLIPLAVTPDRLPAVRVEQPGSDLLLTDASRTIPVRISAADDIGLEMLELRYTKVSGTGEQFEFVEGTIPVTLARASAREWRGEGRLALPELSLEPGDSLVYRAVARDGRSDGLAASETYFLEIAGPGQVALEGVEMPPEDERYALSQQMIVLKIERLRARQASIARDRLVEETANIAAEQRAVRGNFVFLLGGHVEDEEVEAEQSSEISEGRLQNTARRDVNAAIREMTRAEQALVAVDAGGALPPARAAVAALQRAFGKSRYLLRALPGTGRIDPSRRLSGTLATAASWRRDLPAQPAREGEGARRLLSELTRISADAPIDRHTLDQLAEGALASGPSSPSWQEISRKLLRLRAATTAVDRRALLDDVIDAVQKEAGRGLLPRTALPRAVPPLQRAWELKR